jgi:hypothetical protein
MSKFLTTEEINERYDTGIVILTKLFELNHIDLKEKLKEICGDKVPETSFGIGLIIEKTTCNDTPSYIDVCSRSNDQLHINVLGIRYKSDHVEPVQVVLFDKIFTL